MAITRQTYAVELADGRTLTAEVANPDTVRWEMTASRRWPELLPKSDADGNVQFKAPVLMQTFVCWSALKRAGQYEPDFEMFRDADCIGFELTEDAAVDPTQPEAATVSPSV